MSWFKIDDGFHCHPKVLEAGNEAIGFWTRCGSYCAQHLTEGRVPRTIALMYGDMHLVDTLVKVGLMTPVEDGWLIHDYHDYNPTKEKVVTEREAAAKRQREARERARLAREAKAEAARRAAEGHSVSHSVTNAVTNGVSHADAVADDSDRHGVTHAEVTPESWQASEEPSGALDDPSGIAPVQHIADAPSRRDSRVSHGGSHTFPDPTRPVLPTEVRQDKNPAASDALFDVEAPAVPDSKRAGKPRGSAKSKDAKPKADKPNPHAVADDLTRAFYDRHKQRLTQPYVALMKIIRVPIANDVDRDDLARALDLLATEGTAISGGTIRTAMTRVEQARGARSATSAQRPSTTERIQMDGLAMAAELAAAEGTDLATILQFPNQSKELTA